MSAYDDALSSRCTSLCRCFRLTRADGIVQGFTDHDEDVTFDGVTFLAAAALDASEAASSLGMSPDELDATGALSSEAITEADIYAGRYDGAAVEVFDVDWTTPSTRHLLGRYTIGQVERGAVAFRAELRSLSAQLDRKTGRIHSNLCDASVGDTRCGLDLTAPSYSATATVVSVDGLRVTVSGLEAFAPGAFDRGRLRWSSGGNAGQGSDVRLSRNSPDGMVLSLWRAPPAPIEVGETALVSIGCDKTAATCASRFGNLVNFRGFPQMPGESFASSYAVPGDPSLDGGSRL